MEAKIVIVGGGLAGLSLAVQLAQSKQDFLLLEAQHQLGGRILSEKIAGASFDLGPAWFWPGQPRIENLIDRLGLRHFEQYSSGDSVFQDETGAIRRNVGISSMQGSYRIAGGMGVLIDGLRKQLSQSRIQTNANVSELTQTGSGIQVHYQLGPEQKSVTAQKVVLAVPPRVAAKTLHFTPVLPDTALKAMTQTPTWMAGHAKIVAVYDQPYWRNAGLSGDGTSRKGPMVEIHDASPMEGGPYALFGFVGYPAAARIQLADKLVELSKHQLIEIFGPEMANPIAIRLQDWAQLPTISTVEDQTSPGIHPRYGKPLLSGDVWAGNLYLSSTEMGTQFGGFLEGALEAAEKTALELTQV